MINMKSIYVTFEDEEMVFLKEVKAEKSWRKFILEITNYKKEEKNEL